MLDRLKLSGDVHNIDVLRKVLADLIVNSTRKGQGHRFSKETKDLLSIIAVRSMKAASVVGHNLGVSTATLGRHIADSRRNIQFGHDVDIFKSLAQDIPVILESRGIEPGTCPVFAAEDEAAFTRGVMVDHTGSDVYLVGFCGEECEAGHKCTSKPVKVTDFGPTSLESLKELFRKNRQGACAFVLHVLVIIVVETVFVFLCCRYHRSSAKSVVAGHAHVCLLLWYDL